MRLTLLAVLLCLLSLAQGCASETPAEHAANVYAAQEMAAAPPHGNLPDYTLSPEKLAKAQHLETIRTTATIMGTVWGILQLILLLWLGAIGWMRDKALAAGTGLRAKGKFKSAAWTEAFVFALLYLAAGTLLDLPQTLYLHHISLLYGFSIQSWAVWVGDQAKSFAIGWIVTGGIFLLLYWVIRTFPHRWWLVFWVTLGPLIIFGTFITPLVIDPLFNKFEPLEKTQPELVKRLQQVVAKGNVDIPADRMFLMKASAKTTTLNAYVTGFGSSKRLVLWDTSLAKFTPDELLVVFGHESGHYVLGHIASGTIVGFLGLFVVLFAGFHAVRWVLHRFGKAWKIPSQEDWGALAVLSLAVAIFSAVCQPITQSYIRTHEHAADVYGQEVVHGLVANPQDAAKGAFDILGEAVLEDPNPNPIIEVWQYSHPATGRRAAFAHAYNPWADGMEPKYFKKQ